MMKKYSLPRPCFSNEISQIIKREVDRLEIQLDELTQEQKKQLVQVIQEIQTDGIPKKFVLKKLPHGLGSGLFLHPKTSALKKGDVIGSYSGIVTLAPQNIYDDEGSYVFSPLTELLLTKEEQKLHDPKRVFSPKRQYYVKIDAGKKGNFTRFINHSYQPNVVAQLSHIEGSQLEESFAEVVYLAKKAIRPGEQLLVSYEDGEESYWKTMGIKPFPMNAKTFILDDRLELIEAKK
jgi:hypothetical protein